MEIHTRNSPARQAAQKGLWRKRNLVIAGIAVIAIAAGITTWRIRAGSGSAEAAVKLPPVNAPADELIKFAATGDFTTLPQPKQAEYVKVLRDESRYGEYVQLYFDGKITLQDGERAFGNVATAVARQQAREFATLKDPEQRKALLDKALDEADRAEAGIRLALMINGFGQLVGKAPSGTGGHTEPMKLKSWVENLSPADKSELAEYLQAIKDRARDRYGG